MYRAIITPKSIELEVDEDRNPDQVLAQFAKDNILDAKLRLRMQNQFQSVKIKSPKGDKMAFFPREVRLSMAQWLMEAQKAATGPIEFKFERQTCKQGIVVEPLHIRLHLCELGLSEISTVFDCHLPEFNDENRVKGFAKDAKGNKIPCIEILFASKLSEEVKDAIISSFVEGMYLDDCCHKSGCSIFLAKTITVDCHD